MLFIKYLDRYVGILLCFFLGVVDQFIELFLPANSVVAVKKILLIKFWGIGNIVLLLPIMKAVRERYPNAKIIFLTLQTNQELFEDNPYIDQAIFIDVRTIFRFFSSFVTSFLELWREQIDLALDFEQFARISTLFIFLIRAKQRIGFDTERQGRGILYTVRVPYTSDRHMSDIFADIALSAGVYNISRENVHFPLSSEDKQVVKTFLAETCSSQRPLIGMHIGSGDNFIGRRWPQENFARLADILIKEYHAQIVFTGTSKEHSLIKSTIALIHHPVVNACNKFSIRAFAAFIQVCDLFFSNDTSAVHLASALEAPIAAFYGPNTPLLYGPLSRRQFVFYKQLPCSPCITNTNAKTSFCRIPVCIRNITVEEVIETLRPYLEVLSESTHKKVS
jgi:heptosyltransferase-3